MSETASITMIENTTTDPTEDTLTCTCGSLEKGLECGAVIFTPDVARGIESYEDAMLIDTYDDDIASDDLTRACATRLWSAKGAFDTMLRDDKIDDEQMTDILRSFAEFEALLVKARFSGALANQREAVRLASAVVTRDACSVAHLVSA
jgi:hypothetical protein